MRHLYVGVTKKESNVTVERLYVHSDDGYIWLMNLEKGSALRVRHWTLSELSTHFDKWLDLGTIEDGVRVSDVIKYETRYSLTA